MMTSKELISLVVITGAVLAMPACTNHASPFSSLKPAELFDLRSKCSVLANRIGKENKAEFPDDITTVTNLYDPSKNRCYVEEFKIHYQTAINGEAQTMMHRTVIDAQENATLVYCQDYIHGSTPRQTNCTDRNQKKISLNEANAMMNGLMEESIDWP